MVISDLWIDIDSRLEEIFMIPENTFDGLSIITVADLPQLIFWWFSDKDSMRHLNKCN